MIHYQDNGVTLHHGDCLDVLRELPDASVDSVVTDPPYGLEFMGKEWDSFGAARSASTAARVGEGAMTGGAGITPTGCTDGAKRLTRPAFGGARPMTWRCVECGKRDQFRNDHGHDGWTQEVIDPTAPAPSAAFGTWCEQWAAECLRVLKPGGHLLAFGGTRTWHRLACAVEDAGFEVRDSLAWLYGSGFPKSLDVSKAIDKAAGAEREVVGRYQPPNGTTWNLANDEARASIGPVGHSDRAASLAITAPATPDAERWQGWGTALKPAFEPVVVARKPLSGGTVAANVLAHGTGALNIDGCRIEGGSRPLIISKSEDSAGILGNGLNGSSHGGATTAGRWPANVILDEWHEPVLRLRYNLPTEVERTIRESFGASTSHLPAVREVDRSATEQGQSSEVLLSSVPASLDVGEPDGRASAAVGQAAHGRDAGADLSDEAGKPQDGRQGGELEGRPIPESRLRLRETVEPAAARAGGVPFDVDAQRWDIHPGASASGGAATREGADVRRGRAPHQRDEGRQSPGEPRAPRVEQLAPHEARGGRRGDVSPASGERAAQASPLEVLRRECPSGWWHYFDVVGHRREGQAAALDEMSGTLTSGLFKPEHSDNGKASGTYGAMGGRDRTAATYGDTGGASRFFYVAKAPKSERPRTDDGTAHPTVKPLKLMRWLVRLVTPPGGVVLEPFAGSGTTVEACILEGFDVIAIEREADYLPLIEARIDRARGPLPEPEPVPNVDELTLPEPDEQIQGQASLLDLIDGGAA